MDNDPLVKWMVELNAADAEAVLFKFANLTKSQIQELSDKAKKENFLAAMTEGIGKSPAMQAVLLQFAAVEKSALGVAAALRLAGQQTGTFDDLNSQLRQIDELFKSGAVGAGAAQAAISKVADEGAHRTADAEREKTKAKRDAAEEARRIAQEEADYEEMLRQADVALAKQMEAAVTRDHKENVANMIAAEKAAQAQRKADADRAKAEEDARFAKRREAMRTLGFTALGGVGMATAAVHGAASAGFADTLQGQQSQVYGQLLNRQVATIFAPLLEERTKYVAQMTSWLQGLSEPQKESIRSLSMATFSMTTLGFVVPKVTTALASLATTGALGANISRMTNQGGALAGLAGAAGPIGLGIAGVTALLSSSEKGRESLAELTKALEPVANGLAEILKEMSGDLGTAIKDLTTTIRNIKNGNITGAAESGGGFLASYGKMLESWTLSIMPALIPLKNFLAPAGANAANGSSSAGLGSIPKGFEDIGRDYERIFEAATKINLQQQQLDALNQIATNTSVLTTMTQSSSTNTFQGPLVPNNAIAF